MRLALATLLAVSADLRSVDAFIRAEMERQKVPGVAVAIVRGGEVVKAQGYGLANVEHQQWVAPKLNTTADGSLYLSVLDLVAWDRGLRSGAVLKPASWAEVYAPVRLNSGKTYPYGFGWDVTETGGTKVYRHGGAWQGFKSEIARFLGSDLTIVVLANLAEADPDRFTDGIAAILEPRLATPELRTVADTGPEVTARLRAILAAAAAGQLSPEEFAYVRAGFFPDGSRWLESALGGLGSPTAVSLLERTQRGDDRVYTYDVAYASKAFRVVLGLVPDGRVSRLSVRPR